MQEKQIDILEQTRRILVNVIGELSLEQLNTIPVGFNNNIAWNFAHLVVSQQILCYRLSGLECNVEEAIIARYIRGTAPDPQHPMTETTFRKLRAIFLENPGKLREDYRKGAFKQYKGITTSTGVTLADIDMAIAYNTMHEGLHLGYILALKRAIG